MTLLEAIRNIQIEACDNRRCGSRTAMLRLERSFRAPGLNDADTAQMMRNADYWNCDGQPYPHYLPKQRT